MREGTAAARGREMWAATAEGPAGRGEMVMAGEEAGEGRGEEGRGEDREREEEEGRGEG